MVPCLALNARFHDGLERSPPPPDVPAIRPPLLGLVSIRTVALQVTDGEM